ncbi:hypothetical protein [Rhodoluna limnophila]|uniref:hypothetical protein n=1 Tax=Rhodoluna limnophila TaxID=232537 RepID=UPI001562BCCF|nr:hypothetical protein [Rhodoluna limnophila]
MQFLRPKFSRKYVATQLSLLLVISTLVSIAAVGQANASNPPIERVSVGEDVACAVLDGGLACWGQNGNLILGTDNLTQSSTAVRIFAAGSGVTQVSVGSRSACVVIKSGVKCWGENTYGLLGNGSTLDMPSPVVAIPEGSGVTQVAVGTYSSCAVVQSGVRCWGRNSIGQLGNGTIADSLVPVAVLAAPAAELANISKVSVGNRHACAMGSAGVFCWGENSNGQLGNGTDLSSSFAGHVLEGDIATDVASAGDTSCYAVAGALRCWGFDYLDFDGDSTTSFVSVPSTVLGTNERVSNVSIGDSHICVVAGQSVKCAGANWDGQLGNATRLDSSEFGLAVAVGATQVDAGESSTCAVVSNELWCWGANYGGGLGNGELTHTAVPLASPFGQEVSSFAAGDDFSCAVVNGGVECVGANWRGQLGNGTKIHSHQPVSAIPENSGVVAVFVGDSHACAIVGVDRNLYCWGGNDNGQLGDGTESVTVDADGNFTVTDNDRLRPIEITQAGESIESVAMGGDHTCILRLGAVECWGANYQGQLGYNSFSSSLVPFTAVTSGATAIDATFTSTCALLEEAGVQKIKCWGSNWSGGLGLNPELNDQNRLWVPTQTYAAAAGETISSFSMGTDHFCMLIGGGVKCAGANYSGQLGNNSTNNSYEPVIAIAEGSGVTAITAGTDLTCAVAAGIVKCWGANTHGQVGGNFMGRNSTYSTPQSVSISAGPVASIDAYSSHVCAAVESGQYCWGENLAGALGAVRTPSSSVPVLASTVTVARVAPDNPSTDQEEQDGGGTGGSGNSGGGSSGGGTGTEQTNGAAPQLVISKLHLSTTSQRLLFSGTNLQNVQSIRVGGLDAKILFAAETEILLEIPAGLAGKPTLEITSSVGTQTIEGAFQVVKPYAARTVRVSSFTSNGPSTKSKQAITAMWKRDVSVNQVSCTVMVPNKSTLAAKKVALSKASATCQAAAGLSNRFAGFAVAVKSAAVKKPHVNVTFNRTTPVAVPEG